MNHKNERIKKLWLAGITDPARIARKLGLADSTRVLEGLTWLSDHHEIDLDAPKAEREVPQ